MKADLLVHSAAQLITAPPGTKPLVGADLDRPILIEDAAIAVAGERIAAIGTTREILAAYPEREAARVLDARGRLIAPGFIDPHTHLPFAGMREMEFDARARGESYESIAAKGGGIRASVRHLRSIDEAALADRVTARLGTLLRHGITTVEAKSGYGLSPDSETKQLRALRAAQSRSPVEIVPTFLGAHDIPEDYRDRRAAYVDLLTGTMIPEVAKAGLARFCDVWCDVGIYTIEESRAILLAGKAHGLLPKLHADELGDAGAAALAAEVGAVSADHLLFASDAGLLAMAQAGVIAVLLPGTAFTLGLPYARARWMVEHGLAVALATDFNPGSTMSSSMSLALTLAVTQMKLSPAEAWMAATANAASAIGEGARIGRIQPGFQADFCLFDASDYRHIPYHYGHEHLHAVVKRGRVALEGVEAWTCT
ncbi:MAG TPA: imidazolonepropionase [Candidatus Eisenbacteria bacterium]|nr:imidazolonepropionase [Candidatus Eisenbacteria bacterium]